MQFINKLFEVIFLTNKNLLFHHFPSLYTAAQIAVERPLLSQRGTQPLTTTTQRGSISVLYSESGSYSMQALTRVPSFQTDIGQACPSLDLFHLHISHQF